MEEDDKKATMLTTRIDARDLARLEALAASMPALKLRVIAREAMRLGIDALEANPLLALGTPAKKRKAKP